MDLANLLIHVRSSVLRKRSATGYSPAISFQDLGLDFQDSDIMVLRSFGFVILSADEYGLPGVHLDSTLLDYSPTELRKLVNSVIKKKSL